MSLNDAAVRTALDILGPGTRLDISDEDSGLLRYAHSRVSAQHAESRLRVRVRVTRDDRSVTGSLESLEPEAVRALADRLGHALTTLPACPPAGDVVTPIATETPVRQENRDSERPRAADRHKWFHTVRKGLGDDVSLGGAIRNDVVERIVADSDGLFQAESLTKASIQAIAGKGDRSVSVRGLHRDASRIDVDGMAERLLTELAPLPVRDVAKGTHRVLLRPQAVIHLLSTFGYAALGAAGYTRGTTAVAGRLGERIVSDLLTISDDGNDPDGLPSGFDAEGTPRKRTPLVEAGKLTGVVSNLEFAHVTGGISTGHGVPFGWRFGALPSPSHLLMEPGEAGEAELLETLGEGLLVSRLDYLRVLHPKDTLVTGTTRDGTYWVSGGRVVAVHPSVRLTFRMDEVLNAVLAVGKDRERGEVPFMESVTAPALLVDSGPLTV
jgi:predicted Zn-dependent protease